MANDTESWQRLAEGGKRALAEALARLEAAPGDAATVALLDEAYRRPRAQVIGITGPPGVGKSTLLSALIQVWRAGGLTVGVIAVDPSSRRTGGALLGDRLRLRTDPGDAGVFVRSMAARDRLGGLAAQTTAACVLMRALFDRVLVETVGVGQSETAVADLADTVVFCIQPGSGDALQFMKAGIMEIPHLALVTKADLGAPARRARQDVLGALSLAGPVQPGWQTPVLAIAAPKGEGLPALIETLDAHRAFLDADGRLARQRQAQAESWLVEVIRDGFGRDGLARAGSLDLALGESPFGRAAALAARLAGGR